MADFPGNSATAIDYVNKVWLLRCLESGCDWELAGDGTQPSEANLAKALREHHAIDHRRK